MIFKGIVLPLMLCGYWSGSLGAPRPFSSVYVRSSSSDNSPVEYVKFNPVASALAPISAPQILPPVVSSCVSPCMPQAVGMPPSLMNRANIVAYNAPSVPGVPVVIAPVTDDKSSYEYSYVVYDENTGDHKQQQELSNNGVVTGQYSFVQPDGFVREVKYTADDLKGFNAVVKNFLPDGVKKHVESNETPDGNPACDELKNQALKEAPESEKKENNDAKLEVIKGEKASTEENKDKSQEGSDESKKDSKENKDSSKEKIEKSNESKEKEDENNGNISEKKQNSEEKEEPKENISSEESKPKSEEEHSKQTEPASEGESSTSEIKESTEVTSMTSEKVGESTSESSTEKEEETRSSESTPSSGSAGSEYASIIQCIQNAMNKAKEQNKVQVGSPLTYFFLPFKPC